MILHLHMFKIIKGICVDGKEGKDWFYIKITYIISKETLTSGNTLDQQHACLAHTSLL